MSSHGVLGLSPAFLRALRLLLDGHRLLLFEDAVMTAPHPQPHPSPSPSPSPITLTAPSPIAHTQVMTGLRCGAPFLGCACACGVDFVAIGKAWGFSGVVSCERQSERGLPQLSPSGGTRPHAQERRRALQWIGGLRRLNGYLTMRMSAADLVRALAVLEAVHERQLTVSALRSGRRLQQCLQAQGLQVWGLGLLLAFDEAGGESGARGEDAERIHGEGAGSRTSESRVEGEAAEGAADGRDAVAPRLLNASAAFARLLPPLTLGEADWPYLSSCVVRGEEEAKGVAERVLWLQMEAELAQAGGEVKAGKAGIKEMVDAGREEDKAGGAEGGLVTTAVVASADYRPLLEQRLRAGGLNSYASLLSPKLRERLPQKAAEEESADERLEKTSALWADVLAM